MTENMDKRAVIELTGRIARMEKLMAIQEEQIMLATQRGDYWRGECIRQMRRDCGLTDCVSTVELSATDGAYTSHKEDI